MAGSSQGFVNEETYFNRTGRINSANGYLYICNKKKKIVWQDSLELYKN